MNALSEALASKRVLVSVGSGGVGKTTISATLALRAAVDGRSSLVCTIDPAKRLANSLGLNALGNVEAEVPASALELAVHIEAPGFYLEGEHLRTVAVVGGRLKTPNIPLRLRAASSGEHQTIPEHEVGIIARCDAALLP